MALLNFSRIVGALLLSVALSPWAATVALAESIKIGLVDFALKHDTLNSFQHVTVRSITFETTALTAARFQSARNTKGHADVMASELIESFQAAAPSADLELYVASPFLQDPQTGRQSIDLEQLEFAYTWFARQGVKIVAQTFVSRDTPALAAAMEAAQREGLVILTSAGNGPRQNAVPPFPAGYTDAAIGISTTGLSDELSSEENRNTYVRYSVPQPAMSPLKVRQDPEAAALVGSSRATVVAAGLLGALNTRYRIETADDARLLLDTVATPIADFGAGGAYGLGVLMRDAVVQHIKAPFTPPALHLLSRSDRAAA